MNPDLGIAAVVAVVVVAGLAAALLMVSRLGRQRYERLAPAFELGTCRAVGLLGTAVEGLYRGYTCRYMIQHASQYNPGGASLRLAAGCPFAWSAHVADAGSRLMVKAGLLQDIRVADGAFGDRLRFATRDEASLRSLLGTEEVRSALERLLASPNFESVRARDDRLEARWAPRAPQLDDDPEVLRLRLDAIADLAAASGCSPLLAL